MVVCAYVVLSWIIGLACVQVFCEFRRFEPSGVNVLHAICILVLSVLGIIGISVR